MQDFKQFEYIELRTFGVLQRLSGGRDRWNLDLICLCLAIILSSPLQGRLLFPCTLALLYVLMPHAASPDRWVEPSNSHREVEGESPSETAGAAKDRQRQTDNLMDPKSCGSCRFSHSFAPNMDGFTYSFKKLTHLLDSVLFSFLLT